MINNENLNLSYNNNLDNYSVKMIEDVINNFIKYNYSKFITNLLNNELNIISNIKINNYLNDIGNFLVKLFENLKILFDKLSKFDLNKNNCINNINKIEVNYIDYKGYFTNKILNYEKELNLLINEKLQLKSEIQTYLNIIKDYEDKSIISQYNKFNLDIKKSSKSCKTQINRQKFSFINNNFTKSFIDSQQSKEFLTLSKYTELEKQIKNLKKENYNLQNDIDKLIFNNSKLKFKLGNLQLKIISNKIKK